MKAIKSMLFVLCFIFICLFVSGCGSAEIPDLDDVDEETAVELLESKGFEVEVKYKHSDDIDKDYVIKTKPEMGSKSKKNVLVTLYISKGPEKTVPDVTNVDEVTAKNILSSNNLIPTVEYVYDDFVEKGLVVNTSPEVGEGIKDNSKITIYISKGPSYIASSDSTISWWNVSYSGDDKWEFYAPYIQDGKLYVNCSDVTFKKSVEWKDDGNEGYISGLASTDQNYATAVTASAQYSKKKWSADEAQSFLLEVPLEGLGTDRPATVYVKLFANVDGTRKDVEIQFTISW